MKSLKKKVRSHASELPAHALALAARAKRGDDFLGLGSEIVLDRNEKVEKVWGELLGDDPVGYSDPNRWRTPADVRASSFPFCPRKYVLERLGLKVPPDFTVESNFYTEIGKAVHYVAQNALARTGRLWGFWRCPNPKCSNEDPLRITSKKPGFMPESCRYCQHENLEYEEIRLEDEEIGFRGHTDGVIVYKSFSSILEVKTTGDDKITKLKGYSSEQLRLAFQTENPYYGYVHQASTYASLASLKFPQLPPMKYVDFLFFSRDNPKNYVSFRLSVPGTSWWGEIRARIVMAQAARAQHILPLGFARDENDLSVLPSCKYCLYKKACLEPEGKVRYNDDALYSIEAREHLDDVLKKERTRWAALSEATSLTPPTST